MPEGAQDFPKVILFHIINHVGRSNLVEGNWKKLDLNFYKANPKRIT